MDTNKQVGSSETIAEDLFFTEKPPKGMRLIRTQNGYTLLCKAINGPLIGLWLFLVSLSSALIIGCLINGVYWGAACTLILLYLAYQVTFFAFERAKVVIDKDKLRIYTLKGSLNPWHKPYTLQLHDLRGIRFAGAFSRGPSRASSSSSIYTFHSPGVTYLELTFATKNNKAQISLFRKEYTIYLSHLLRHMYKISN